MSAIQVAPSGERSQGVVCRSNPVWSIPERLKLKFHERRYTSTLYLFKVASVYTYNTSLPHPTVQPTMSYARSKIKQIWFRRDATLRDATRSMLTLIIFNISLIRRARRARCERGFSWSDAELWQDSVILSLIFENYDTKNN